MGSQFLARCLVAVSASIASLVYVSASLANDVREISTDEKWARSDIVVVGTVRLANVPGSPGLEHSTIEVVLRLKGSPPNTITIISDDSVAEFSPVCCVAGASYLLFLQRGEGEVYQSINGPFGIYRVSGHPLER